MADPFIPIMVTTTSDNREMLEKLAQYLVDHRLAACVQIYGPFSSCYSWKGAFEKNDEYGCSIKTYRSLFNRVEKAVSDLHNYDVPQIVAVEFAIISESYMQWMQDVLDLE